METNKKNDNGGTRNESVRRKGDSINFSTPTIEGTVTRRNKPDVFNNHPWKVEYTPASAAADPITSDWFFEVYEPVIPVQHSAEPAGDGTRGKTASSK